jgi:hypothetical protein
MLVLCYGIQKSGSTLAFELVRGVLESAGFEQPFLRNERFKGGAPIPAAARNYIERVTQEKIVELSDTIGPHRKIAVKTHGAFRAKMLPWLEGMQTRGALQVIVSWRDPRDICLSLLDAGATSRDADAGAFSSLTTLDDAVAYVDERLARYRKWAALRGTLRLDYDTVAFTPDKAIAAIEKALGVTSDYERVKRHAFEEADTRKNKAVPDRYRTELTGEQSTKLAEAFRRFLMDSRDAGWPEKHRHKLLVREA